MSRLAIAKRLSLEKRLSLGALGSASKPQPPADSLLSQPGVAILSNTNTPIKVK